MHVVGESRGLDLALKQDSFTMAGSKRIGESVADEPVEVGASAPIYSSIRVLERSVRGRDGV